MTTLGTRGISVSAIMISTTLGNPEGVNSKVQPLPADTPMSQELQVLLDKRHKENKGRPGMVPWQPTGVSTHLFCLTVFDLLSACMLEAAYVRPDHATFSTRFKDNYFAMLAALHKYWIIRIPPPHLQNDDCRPKMTSIYCFRDTIVLGSSLLGITDLTGGKELLRRARYCDIQGRRQKIRGLGQVVDLSQSFRY